jgi:regulatory protein
MAMPPEPDQIYDSARNAALHFLSFRPRSEAEVRHRLMRRYTLHLINRVILTLREQRYLDDTDFARQWRINRETFRPKSKEMLRHELVGLGVSGEIADEALKGFDAEDNAYRAGRKLARRMAASDYARFRRRLWAYLVRRGFSNDLVERTVERLWNELTNLLHRGVDTETDYQ